MAEPLDLSHVGKEAGFMLMISNVKSVDFTSVEARGTFFLAARCESNASTGRAKPLPKSETLAMQGKRQFPVGVGCPTGNELNSVQPLGCRGEP